MEEGHWACGYGGPSFLLPGLIFAMYISHTTILPGVKSRDDAVPCSSRQQRWRMGTTFKGRYNGLRDCIVLRCFENLGNGAIPSSGASSSRVAVGPW